MKRCGHCGSIDLPDGSGGLETAAFTIVKEGHVYTLEVPEVRSWKVFHSADGMVEVRLIGVDGDWWDKLTLDDFVAIAESKGWPWDVPYGPRAS